MLIVYINIRSDVRIAKSKLKDMHLFPSRTGLHEPRQKRSHVIREGEQIHFKSFIGSQLKNNILVFPSAMLI